MARSGFRSTHLSVHDFDVGRRQLQGVCGVQGQSRAAPCREGCDSPSLSDEDDFGFSAVVDVAGGDDFLPFLASFLACFCCFCSAWRACWAACE